MNEIAMKQRQTMSQLERARQIHRKRSGKQNSSITSVLCLVCCLLLTIPNSGLANSLKGSWFQRIGDVYGIDPLLLYSIALIQAGSLDGESIAPQPYSLRINGHLKQFDTEKEAREQLDYHLSRGERNIAVGMMQINIKYFPHGDPAHLLDPFANIAEGSRILKRALLSSDDEELAIGHYFEWVDEEKARYFGHRVLSTYRNLVFFYL